MIRRLATWLISRAHHRMPDRVIGGASPYLRRWHLLPRNRLFNVYLHEFQRSDDDRALHDHMYFNLSILLRGAYIEHTIAAGGINRRTVRRAGSMVLRSPWRAHRVELLTSNVVVLRPDGRTTMAGYPLPCWSLFITGPRMRNWGFHCRDAGWIPWQRFTDPATNGDTVGKGCDP